MSLGLAIGRPARAEDRLLVAELAGGTAGVVRVLLAAAKAERWLVDEAGGWRVLADARVKDPLGAALKDRIAARSRAVTSAELHVLASEVAQKDHAARVQTLERDGLLVGSMGRMGRSIGMFMVADVAAGGAYIAWTSGDGDVVRMSIGVVGALFALIAWPTSALNLMLMTRGTPMRTSLGNRTLDWLRESSAALLEDVSSHRRLDTDSVAMAAALGSS